MVGRYISQPHPEDVRRIVTALLQPTPPQMLDITCIPEPWRSAIMGLGRSDRRPEPVLYGLAAYCAQRATHPSVTPPERGEWIAVHDLARSGMHLRRRGGPSGQLPRVHRLHWKLIYEEARRALERLPRSRDPGDGLVKPDVHAVRKCLRPFGLGADANEIEQVRADLTGDRCGQTWEGLQALLAAAAGLSPSAFRKQVVEWARYPRKRSPEQQTRRKLLTKIFLAKTPREHDRLQRLYERRYGTPLSPPLGITARRDPSS